MQCRACSAELIAEARFCVACGAPVPEEAPAAVAEYREALVTLGRRSEAWAQAELEALRQELSIRPSTHSRLLAELDAGSSAKAPISAWVDTAPMADYRAGAQCLVRIRVVNEGARALRSVQLSLDTGAGSPPLTAQTRDILGPGAHEVLSVVLRIDVAGHHQLTGRIEARALRGPEERWALEPFGFRVAGASALQQSIHIDARAQRVGIFENIGTQDRGGFVGDGDWRRIGLSAEGARAEAPREPGATPEPHPAGHRGTGTVRAVGDALLVEVDGQQGVLVELADPGIRQVLRPGDSLRVTVIGVDGSGRLLLSDRSAVAPAKESPAGGEIAVGPGDDLAAIVLGAPAGARITVTGTHQGPVRIDRAVQLTGDGVLETRRGPALRIAADALIEGLRIVGTAPPGAYAPDCVEVRGGRVVLERCDIRSDAPGNLTPGRGIAVVGRATVELTDCAIHGCGVGIAVDVGWGGFPTDEARGARVTATRCALHHNGIAAGIAGPDRELRLFQCQLSDNADGAVRATGGSAARLEDCVLPEGAATADATSTLSMRRGPR